MNAKFSDVVSDLFGVTEVSKGETVNSRDNLSKSASILEPSLHFSKMLVCRISNTSRL